MTEAQAIRLISNTFRDAWPAASGNLPLALDNEAMPSADSYATLSVKHTTSQQMTMGPVGSRRFRRDGHIYVKLWGPVDAGRAGLSALVGAVRIILEAVSLVVGSDALTTQAAYTRELGADGKWWMCVVQIPFWYVEQR